MQIGTFLLACAWVSVASADDSDLVSAVRTAYAANRVAMPFGTLKFEFAVGYAAGIDAVRRGELSKKIAREGSYFYDGSMPGSSWFTATRRWTGSARTCSPVAF